MKFLMMVRIDETHQMTPEESEAHMREVGAWVEGLSARGVRLIGGRLRPAADATVVRVRDGELLVSDGPYAETKEQLGGFDILECADLKQAIEVASAHPGAPIATIEVRPFWE
jgi:hypothetical protein